jgi:hypothetical protein
MSKGFDLSEKFGEWLEESRPLNYETISEATVLQTISIILANDCTKKQILCLNRAEFIDARGRSFIKAVLRFLVFVISSYACLCAQLPYSGTSCLIQFVLYLKNLFASCYSLQYCVNLKTFDTPAKVKLFESPGKSGGLAIVFTKFVFC